MLQQTQVATVIPYFQKFEAAYPDVHALALADNDAVMQLWAGLGYYARARNLKRTAEIVANDLAGEFPDSVEALTELPGIGRSTAGAIMSLGHGRRAAILDGNVKRVLARAFAIEGWPGRSQVLRELWALAETLTPTDRVAQFNQAMMDLGATICTRSSPRCEQCPFVKDCEANATGRQVDFPGRKPKKAKPKKSATLVILRAAGQVFLERRPARGIWGGLWSLPEFEDRIAAEAWLTQCGLTASLMVGEQLDHSFTHYDLAIEPLIADCAALPPEVADTDAKGWFAAGDLKAIGSPAPVAKLLGRYQLPSEQP